MVARKCEMAASHRISRWMNETGEKVCSTRRN
jgi:hypothetical protein